MAPQISLREILTYATQLLSQYPLSVDVPNPLGLADAYTVAQQEALVPGGGGPDGGDLDVVPYIPLSGAPSCPLDGPVSCHNRTAVGDGDACCFVHPGGRLLLAQFWDREVHVEGADEDWTLHGLWPDNCDGSYDTYCSVSPRFYNITAILRHHDQTELLEFMDRYWVADSGSNAQLWAHEWNKHGTCVNTLAPACYANASDSSPSSPSSSDSSSPPSTTPASMAVVDYFARAASLFRSLDTYRALHRAGITPTLLRRYPLAEVRAALERFSGGRVTLRCAGPRRDALHEVWYAYFVKGSLQTGEFVPARDDGEVGEDEDEDEDEDEGGNCAPWVRYQPKVKRRAGLLGWIARLLDEQQ